MDERPLTRGRLGSLLAEQWPGHDPASLAHAISCLLPHVQVPPRGIWGTSGQPAITSVESWLGRPLGGDSFPDKVVLRYLAAFGPAPTSDVRTRSGLPRLSEVIARLRPGLATFHDEQGRELFDLPHAPRPDL